MTTTTTTTPAPIPLGLKQETDLCRDIICGPKCEWIFARVMVHPVIKGGTRVEWTLHPHFDAVHPLTFRLQVGRTGNPLADDWKDVGSPVVDTYQATDPYRRVVGKLQWTHYRVLVNNAGTIYASKPQPALGAFNKADWLYARELVRLEEIRLQKEAGAAGYFLKRRNFGEACECLDQLTGEIRNPQHIVCYGTGIVGGYFDPLGCFYVELPRVANRLHNEDTRGPVNDKNRGRARMINIPQIQSYDIWVEKDTDNRWVVHDILELISVRGRPIVVSAELRLAPASDIVYQFPISS